jgi:short-subunit dehydrogenase
LSEHRIAEEPRAMLVEIAESVWIAESSPIHAAGMPLPIRMTVIRLASGELILHSPVRYSRALHAELEALGSIQYLLAPDIAHWTFIKEWQEVLPRSQVLAVEGLRKRHQVRQSGLRIDVELTEQLPEAWAADLDAVLISAPPFVELAVFHKASRTLVLTDLVQNLDPHRMPAGPRLLARLLGIVAPSGRAPIYLRALLQLWHRRTRPAAERLIAMSPERVVFSHGMWFADHATERLRRSLSWLLRDDSPVLARSREMAGLRIVVTGASSGIGRATALVFAAKGASVTLAARRAHILHALAEQCAELGGRALVCPTDVTDAASVATLADKAVDAFGGIDVWINNAGTGVFGPFHKADIELHRQTLNVNLLGAVHGAHAALPVFLRQRRGVLINNISLGGWAPTPYAAAYTASKFGLRGFTASLRQEMGNHPDIRICAVFPSMIDTPGFVHGANVSGKSLDPGPFLYRADDVARTMLAVVRRPRDEVAVGWPARAGQLSYIAMRGTTERLMGYVFRLLLSRAKAAPVTPGALLTPTDAGISADGGWLARKQLPSAGTLTKVGIAAAIGIAVLAGTGALARRTPRQRRGRPR